MPAPVSTEASPGEAPGGDLRDGADDQALRWNRDRHEGFPVGRFLQPAPMLFSRDGHNLFLGDIYRGATAFLLCSGPSLNKMDLSLLEQRGILTMAINNAAVAPFPDFAEPQERWSPHDCIPRPNLWVSVDDPGNFSDAIWRDPGIWKFVPLCHTGKRFYERDQSNHLIEADSFVEDQPAVFYYRRNEDFKPKQFLYEDTFNWGNHKSRTDELGIKGSRSAMLIALRMLFYLGVRKVFILGADFRMSRKGSNYAFPQGRSKQAVKNNNNTYKYLNRRLQALQPYFQREGYRVYNSTPDSGLTVYKYVPLEEAVQIALRNMPEFISTSGMYERAAKEKERAS